MRRRGEKAAQAVPGWPYSFVAALGPGASSWTVLLDAVRIGPGDDETELAAAQLREVAGRLIAAGQWEDGDPDIVIAMDAGYNVTRLAWLLADLPVVLVARVRADRVFYADPAPWKNLRRIFNSVHRDYPAARRLQHLLITRKDLRLLCTYDA